ncbi:MAG TPA: hypothetical protein VIN36_00195 [Thiobacillus sp.]
MGTVTVLPCNARTLNGVREEVGHMAKRYGCSESKRRAAFVHAVHLMEEGASSAWAVQAARQELRNLGRVTIGRPTGDAA